LFISSVRVMGKGDGVDEGLEDAGAEGLGEGSLAPEP